MTDYSKLSYWEERYENHPDPFDWYQIYFTLKDKIFTNIKPTDKILVLGAGTSTLSESMYEDGFRNITNIDYCPMVVSIMQHRYKDMGLEMQYVEGDVTNMQQFQNEQFNIIIDKGTLDSILCGENSLPLVDKMIKEVYRLLATNGVYYCISYGDEDHRKTFFTNSTLNWEFSVDTITKLSKDISANVDSGNKDPKNYHYIYTMIKLENTE